MSKLKVAVIGAGIYGTHHIDVYRQNPNVDLVCVCDQKDQIRKKVEKIYGLKTYSNVEEMLDNESLDAVSIATPDHLHLEPSLQCIEKGLHILVEKPLATTVKDCEDILNKASDKGVRVAVDFHKRWDPSSIYVYNLLRSDEGFPIRGYMSMDDKIDIPLKWFNWGESSSPVDFLGVHCVDLMRWYMGCEATEVFSVGTKKLLTSLGKETYDSVQSIITFENGCTWVLENSWVIPSGFPKPDDSRTSILTSKKYIRIDNQNRGIEMFDNDNYHTPNVFFFNKFNEKVFGFGADPINDFVDSLLNSSDFIASGKDGLKAAKITEAIHRSLETGNKVKIK